MRSSTFLAWGLGLVALGCASGPGRIESGHYTSKLYPLEVVGSGDVASAGLMPKGWKLENFYGSPLPDSAKETDEYKVVWEFDRNGDGHTDLRHPLFLYELRFQSLVDDAAIWLRVVPVSKDRGDVQLPVLLESYVQSLSRGNYAAVKLETYTAAIDKHFAASLVSTQPCRLAETECQVATIDVANVDQLKVAPNARAARIQVVIARANLVFEAHHYEAPTFVVVGYSNQPARFEAGLPDFQDLLGRVAIRGQRGFKLVGSSEQTPAAAGQGAGPSAPNAETNPPNAAPSTPNPSSAAPNPPSAATFPVGGGETPVGATPAAARP